MVQSRAQTVKEYLTEIPADRRKEIETVRKIILANLPKGYEEGMDYGMIVYYIPLSRYPDTYNKHPLAVAALAAQKNYLSVYLNCVYGDAKYMQWFKKAYAASGKKLDMGKSCVRFKTADDLPLDVIGETVSKVPVDKYIEFYEAARNQLAARKTRK